MIPDMRHGNRSLPAALQVERARYAQDARHLKDLLVYTQPLGAADLAQPGSHWLPLCTANFLVQRPVDVPAMAGVHQGRTGQTYGRAEVPQRLKPLPLIVVVLVRTAVDV